MLYNNLIGFGLFVGYFIVLGLVPLVLFRVVFKLPFELVRKMLHILITLSIFPLLYFFNPWYHAIHAVIAFVVIIYPVLKLIENSPFYQRVAVERDTGEFKRSFIIVQLSISILITIFWGLLGEEWRYIVVVAVLAWGFGDAAAALIGKAFGHRRIRHPRIEGAKTYEGTLAMYIVSGVVIFGTLLLYAGQPLHVSFTVALLVAPVCAVVELFSNHGMDTLTVPLSAAFSIFPLMLLITLLEI